ncbi:MAG: DNA polymerase I [Ilumatobacteraceae bacterium]
MGTFLLIDGNSLTYRAFFALPTDMATASGQVTNAVFGFTSMLINVVKEHRPDGVLVAFDRPEPTFRHEAEPSYKAQREQAPDILRQQLGLVRQVLDVMGIQQIEASGWEADDLIATAADAIVARGGDVIIVTGDRDSYQLVADPHVRVLYNKRGVSDYALYDEAGIIERTGVTPALYPQYAALRGDPSDNLPGVPGVGEKTAAKLITTYGGLDGIFANVGEQTPKLRENLTAHEERVRRNLDLMLLRHDAPIDTVDLDDLAITPDAAELRRLFDFLEFKTLGDRLTTVLGDRSIDPPDGGGSAAGEIVADVVDVASVDEAIALLAGLEVVDLAGAWTADPGRGELLGVAVVSDPVAAVAAWIPASMLTDPAVAAAFGGCRRIRGHQVKSLMRSLLGIGVDLKGLVLDVAIAAYLLEPAEGRYELTELLPRYTSWSVPSNDAAASGRLDLDGSSVGDRGRAGRDALAVHHLSAPVEAALAESGLIDLYRSVENPLVRVLARMEHVGVGVDAGTLRSINDRLTGEVESLVAELRRVSAHESLNPNSPTQLRALLFDERGLSPQGVKKTKSGYSTDAQTLEKLRDQWPDFIEPLLRHREVEKLRGTYGEGLLHEVAADGRIHATFNQTVARTGRLSSDRPNLHNIPVRSDEGRVFRSAFVPRAGCELLVADYNQIELRCIAHLASDPGLIEAFRAGQDIHSATAARVFGVDPSRVTVDQRSKAKMVSYGLAYGMEAYGLGQRLNIPTDEASEILDAYFAAFPHVKSYMEATVAEARKRGYTETLFGRRRPIPELLDSNWRVRQAGERQAMNAGIQGLAADIFKVALVRVDAALDEAGIGAELVLQVHDEVIVEVPEDEREVVGPLVIGIMEGAAELDVPLAVNVAWGRSWAEAKG